MAIRSYGTFKKLLSIFFITIIVMGWKHVFTKSKYLNFLIESLRFFQDQRNVYTVGYCLMPNHVHWIVNIAESDYDITVVIKQSIINLRGDEKI